MMTRALWTHLVKDLRIEWRSLDAIVSMLFFSGLVVVLFSIAFDPRGAFSQQIAGGVLCVATMFASVSALNQAWAREIRHQVMDAQRMVPAPGAELYLAKVIANFLFVSIVQLVLAPFFFIFYNLHILGQGWLLALVLPLGTWALVANGIFFAALSIRSRNRELLLSLILFPIFIPACWPWFRLPPPSSPAKATRPSGSSCWWATTSSSPRSACCCLMLSSTPSRRAACLRAHGVESRLGRLLLQRNLKA